MCIASKKNSRNDKTIKSEIRNAILNMLSDNNEHDITELYELNYNMSDIDQVLINMALEEEVLNNDGRIVAHFKQ